MSAESARRPATYEDVLAAPEHHIAEILGGTLYTQPRPAGLHSYTASSLGAELLFPFSRGRGGPGGWAFLDAPELHLGDDIIVPDLGGWRTERMPPTFDCPYFTTAPDFVCEVLSPSTRLIDRRYKLPIYARENVTYIWLVDPRVRSIEAFRLQDTAYTLLGTYGEDDKVRIEPFAAIELDLSALWAPGSMNLS